MKLSIIIVNYNVKHYLRQCLDSVLKAVNGIDAEVFVVDNHSRDGSVNYLERRYKSVMFIECNHNLGFARANNIAIRQCTGEYILLLNPDTIIGESTLHNMISFMDNHPDAGGAGVKMLKCDGEKALESRRGLPTPMTAFYKMCGLCKYFPNSKRFGQYYMGYLPWDKPVEIEIISGAFCFLRKKAIDRIGLIDEDFFMYGEDIDLSYRLLKAGFKNWYVPETILHYKGESTQKSSFRYVHVFYEAMFIFFKKHYGNASLIIALPIKMAIYLKATIALIRMQTSKIRKVLGFFTPKRRKEPDYLFIGSASTIGVCKALSRKKGLLANFVVGTEATLPDGHNQLPNEIDSNKLTFVVYDTDSFSFNNILNNFTKKPNPNVRIATYDNRTHTLITEEDIIR